jgi:hypothetical protein
MSENRQPQDHAPGDNVDDDDVVVQSIEDHVKSKATWLRLFYIVVFFALYFVSRVVMVAVVVLQFFWLLFTGAINEQLRALGQSLAGYTYEIVRFLTFNSDVRPFPFDAPWPPSVVVEESSDGHVD